MTVKELIQKLSKYDNDYEVYVRSEENQYEYREPAVMHDCELIQAEWTEFAKHEHESDVLCTAIVRYYEPSHHYQKNKPFKAIIL